MDSKKKTYIPEISDARLEELYRRIKPVVRMARIKTTFEKHADGSSTTTYEPHPEGEWMPWESGELYYIKAVDPRTIAFTWDPKPTKRAGGLKELAVITTYHTYGYYGFFKPSIAEVLAQIPDEYLAETVAFEVRGPQDAEDLNRHRQETNDGYHVAETTLYCRK